MSRIVIGVIGAGVMGTGVAQSFAQAGHPVVLIDVSAEVLERARQKIVRDLRFTAMFGQGEYDPAEVLDRITFTTDYQSLREVGFVVENVTEKWALKREVYRQIDAICPDSCMFGVNTSAIMISQVASVTRRPERVIGMHFMNPVPLKPTVEVIRGYHTTDETVAFARELLRGIGKDSIVVNDSPGFVSNRVMMLTVNEAIFILQEGVANSSEDVDRIFKTCFGHKMGPLETADLIGLDTILLSLEVLYEGFNDSKYRPCPLLKKLVSAGLLGRKSGEGFYKY
jgi:3-hydroxybutyryl-CoA dehydrogenase